MGTRVAPCLIFLLKIGLICKVILPYSEGLPQLNDVLFPDVLRCRQQGGRNCPGVVSNQVRTPPPSRVQQQQPCSGTRAFSQAPEGCDLLQGNVLSPGDNSKCAKVLSQGPCPRGQWVILSNDIGGESRSICGRRQCGGADKVLMNGQCYHVNDNSVCPITMTLQTNEFGVGECECPLGMIYHQESNQCYTPYSQGPCQPGFIIKAEDLADRGISKCVRNPCPEQNMAPLNQLCNNVPGGNSISRECHRIDSAGPCSTGKFSIDGTSAEPGCSDRTIFGHLSQNTRRPCRRGSRRDRAGHCRRVFNNGSNQPNTTRRPQTNCGRNELLLGGRCIPRG